VNTQPAAAIGIPRAIKVVFERQVARLDGKTRSVLDLAAVLGRRLADLTLYEAVDCSPAEAGEGLARLRDEGLVREVHGDVEFRNELIRAQAYYAVPAPARQFLHRRLGLLLRSRSGSSTEQTSLEVAWHFLRGHALHEAMTLAIEGAEAALSVGAPSEAEQVLRAVLGEAPDQQTATRARLLLARALLDQSKAGPALPILEALEASAGCLGPPEQAVLFRMMASAEYLVNRHHAPRHRLAAEKAVRAARQAHDTDLIIGALFEYARAGVETGDDTILGEAHEELTSLVQSSTRPAPPMAYYGLAYCTYFLEQDPRICAQQLTTAISLLEGSRRLGELSLAYNGLALSLEELLDLPAAEQALLRALGLAKQIADDSRCSIVAGNLCSLCTVSGRFAEAVEAGHQSIRFGKRALNQPALMNSYLNLAEAYMMLGRPDDARECWSLAEKQSRDENRWRTKLQFSIESANLALLEGNVGKAIDLLSTAEQVAESKAVRLGAVIGLHKWQAFLMAHTSGFDGALEFTRGVCDSVGSRNPLVRFEMTVVLAWIERHRSGSVSRETVSILSDFERFPLAGRRALLTAQGFLQ
jgi:tetratricopeptide (TPR) repeat protein